MVSVRPAATPRLENRALSVTTGIASHASAGLSCPPDSTMLPAMSSWESPQPSAIRYSGRGVFSIPRSTRANTVRETSSTGTGHQPTHGPEAMSAAPRIPIAAMRTGLMRRSMSSRRVRSASAGHSQEVRPSEGTVGTSAVARQR